MPVRDAAAHLGECLDSILAQSLREWELLVVDDGSRDGCTVCVQALARRDPRVRLLRRPREGLVAALRHALAEARAALVARMDADDRMHPLRLELQARALHARPGLTLVASRVAPFPDDALGTGTREYLRWQNACLDARQVRDEIYVESPFAHPSVMFRRDTVMRLGGYRDGPFPEDYELWLRLAQAGCVMEKLPQVLLQWRQHPRSLSRTDPRYAREAFDALRARYLARDARLDPSRALVVWGAGRRTRHRFGALQRAGRRPCAWIDIDPRKIGNRVAGLPVHPPAWLAGRQPRPFVLGYVASHGAREQIARALQAMDYRVGTDFLMVG